MFVGFIEEVSSLFKADASFVDKILCLHIGHNELVSNHLWRAFGVNICPQCLIRTTLSDEENVSCVIGQVVLLGFEIDSNGTSSVASCICA